MPVLQRALLSHASVFLCRRKSSDALLGMTFSSLSTPINSRIDTSYQRPALKQIPRDKLVTAQQQERLEAEKRILLRSPAGPFLCRGVGAWEDERKVSLLLEHIDGRPLYQCIWGYRDAGRFPEHVAKFFAAQIVLAVQELHGNGYVHRDLKSGNILVNRAGKATVIDFGLSKRLARDEGDDSLIRANSLCGTPYILAPEVFQRRGYGYAVDWWYASFISASLCDLRGLHETPTMIVGVLAWSSTKWCAGGLRGSTSALPGALKTSITSR